MKKSKTIFTTQIEYRVRDEWLVPKIIDKLGKGKRVDQRISWTRKVSDVRKFARELANLQAELDVKLTWRTLA